MNTLTAVVPDPSGPHHGECFLWRAHATGTAVAVDAGQTIGVGKLAGSASPEILILSHDDKDHIGGAVCLISEAGQSLKELWVPIEWGLLIKQLAETGPEDLLPESTDQLSTEGLKATIADQSAKLTNGGENAMTERLLTRARENLGSWHTSDFGDEDGFLAFDPTHRKRGWYGAKKLDKVIERVQRSGEALIRILSAALANSMTIRFFSIDLALSQATKTWETEGRPGTATLANAAEVPHWRAVHIPTGLPHAFALAQLTVQNRRALCTLLWRNTDTPDGGAIIWSDSDGDWLDHSSPLGLSKVISRLGASSAPHHASSNPSHNRVWTELSRAPDDMVMISAGGMGIQGHRPEYLAMGEQRCCTWCRPSSTQEVCASSTPAGHWTLHQKCKRTH